MTTFQQKPKPTNRINAYFETPPRHALGEHAVDVVLCSDRKGAVLRWKTASPTEAAEKLKENLRNREYRLRILALENENNNNKRRIEVLESLLCGGESSSKPIASEQVPDDSEIRAITSMTEKLFSANVQVHNESYTDDPSEIFSVFDVSCIGDIKDLLSKKIQWGRMLDQSWPHLSGKVRLALYPES